MSNVSNQDQEFDFKSSSCPGMSKWLVDDIMAVYHNGKAYS